MSRLLLQWGMDLYLEPTHVAPPLPDAVARVLTKRLIAPFDLAIHHVDPTALDLQLHERSAAEFVLGWTMWEWTDFTKLEEQPEWDLRLKHYDVIACYDEVTRQAMETVAPEGTPLPVVQGGYWAADWPYLERDWNSDRFGFCMVGQLHDRKDPFLAIQAFQELKHEKGAEFDGAELHLKTGIPGLHPAMEEVIPKLRVHYASWPEEILKAFYAKQHCLLAPSRGEGKNMPALEFQSTGGVVIATNWGGHQQWLNPAYSYPLDYELRPEAGTETCLQARAKLEHLKELMWHVYTHREECRRKGELASRTISQMCDWTAVMDRLFRQVASVVPGKGQEVLNKFVYSKREVPESLTVLA